MPAELVYLNKKIAEIEGSYLSATWLGTPVPPGQNLRALADYLHDSTPPPGL